MITITTVDLMGKLNLTTQLIDSRDLFNIIKFKYKNQSTHESIFVDVFCYKILFDVLVYFEIIRKA